MGNGKSAFFRKNEKKILLAHRGERSKKTSYIKVLTYYISRNDTLYKKDKFEFNNDLIIPIFCIFKSLKCFKKKLNL